MNKKIDVYGLENFNTGNMEKLLKLIHRFNAISIRIPALSLWKLTSDSKMDTELQGIQNSQNNL